MKKNDFLIQDIIGNIGAGRGGKIISFFDKGVIPLLKVIVDLNRLRTEREKYKNIKGRWRLSTFSHLSPGAGKPLTRLNLVGDVVVDKFNAIILGETRDKFDAARLIKGMPYKSIATRKIGIQNWVMTFEIKYCCQVGYLNRQKMKMN